MHMARNLHIYLKDSFDWSVENGQITLTRPDYNNKVKKAGFLTKNEQKQKREDIAEKYLNK